MTLTEAIAAIEQECQNPNAGLPFEVFKLVSKLTPMINVDLLIKDASGKTLLTWREDPLCKAGWHIPGGIIRFMENIDTRIHKVAIAELGADVSFEKKPLAVTEFIIPKQAYLALGNNGNQRHLLCFSSYMKYFHHQPDDEFPGIQILI